MKIYNYQKFSNVYLGGSVLNKEESLIPIISKRLSSSNSIQLHPKEIERQERLSRRKKSPKGGLGMMRKGDGTFNDSVIIFSGSTGFGSKSFEHFDEIFKSLNEILEKNNTHIIFIRGNSDDPSYFTEGKISYSNIKAVDDYSLIKFNGFNCLCIGGGVSLDRKWKQTQGGRLKKTLYWDGESTKFNQDELKEILADNKIACVVTHVPPSFVGTDTSTYSDSKWSGSDKEVIDDAINERLTIDKIYSEFVKANVKPYVWMFTGEGGGCHLNNIRFVASTDIHNIFSLNDTVEGAFGFRLEMGDVSKTFKKVPKRFTDSLHGIQAPRNQQPRDPYQELLDDLNNLDGDAEMEMGVDDVEEERGEPELEELPEFEAAGVAEAPRNLYENLHRDLNRAIDQIHYEPVHDRRIFNTDELLGMNNGIAGTYVVQEGDIAGMATNVAVTTDDGEGHG